MCRNLTPEQQELMIKYAETETNLNGKVDGVDQGQFVHWVGVSIVVDSWLGRQCEQKRRGGVEQTHKAGKRNPAKAKGCILD